MLHPNTLSDKWPVVPLGDAVEFLDNLRKPVKESERVEGDYPYYGANGLQGSINDYIFDEPLVLLAEDGGHFGNPDKTIAYIAEGKYWVNNHAHVLKPKPNVDLNFLHRVLEKYDVRQFVKGATRAKLTKGDAARIPFPLPPLEEQKRIAAILDKADALRRKRQQAIELSEQFLKSVFQDMFGDPVMNPKGWDTCVLGDLIKKGPTNGLYKPASEYGDGTRILRIDGFYNGVLEDQNKLKRVRLAKSEIEKYTLSDNSIVINRVNSREYLGKCAFITGLVEPTVFESNMMNFEVVESSILPEFLVHQLCTPYVKGQILNSCKDAVNQSSINQQDVKALKLRIPPIALQSKYLDVVTKTRDLVLVMRKHILETHQLNLSLIQQVFADDFSRT